AAANVTTSRYLPLLTPGRVARPSSPVRASRLSVWDAGAGVAEVRATPAPAIPRPLSFSVTWTVTVACGSTSTITVAVDPGSSITVRGGGGRYAGRSAWGRVTETVYSPGAICAKAAVPV